MASSNLERVQRKMLALVRVADEAARLAMEKAADEIVTLMKSLAPVDDGDLRDSIGWTWGEAPKYSQRVGAVKTRGAALTITIYAGNDKVRYPHLVEFGSAPHKNGGLFPGTEHPGTNAQPFFFVAWRSNRKKATAAINRAIKKSVKEFWQRGN